MMVKISLTQLLILRELIGCLQSRAKLNAFEHENKERRESNNHTIRPNWSSFKVIHFSTQMSSQSSTWKMTTPIKLDIT